MIDTTSKHFMAELSAHLNARREILYTSIMSQPQIKDNERVDILERDIIDEQFDSISSILLFIDEVETSVEKSGFLDRKMMK